jgi:hypothetical protein
MDHSRHEPAAVISAEWSKVFHHSARAALPPSSHRTLVSTHRRRPTGPTAARADRLYKHATGGCLRARSGARRQARCTEHRARMREGGHALRCAGIKQLAQRTATRMQACMRGPWRAMPAAKGQAGANEGLLPEVRVCCRSTRATVGPMGRLWRVPTASKNGQR